MNIPDFEGERSRQKKENCRLNQISESKIKKYCKTTGYDYNTILKKIKIDEAFRWFFIKDPIRQNIHEQTVIKFIKNISGVKNFKKYSNNEMYIVNGGLVLKSKLDTMTPSCKSIDFYWEFNNKKIYAYHKYTKDSGGHQDNQYEDLKKFIDVCNSSSMRNVRFLAIADGAFYNTQNGKANTTKIKRLKDLANERNTFALTSYELVEWLKKL